MISVTNMRITDGTTRFKIGIEILFSFQFIVDDLNSNRSNHDNITTFLCNLAAFPFSKFDQYVNPSKLLHFYVLRFGEDAVCGNSFKNLGIADSSLEDKH